jgi:putative phage-type endonuclease
MIADPVDVALFPDAEVIDVDPEHRDAWLAQRRLGIGSSDAPAIVGLDRFRSPLAVWNEKLHGSQQDDNAAMVWGRRLEAAVAEHYAAENGVVLVKPSVMWRSREYPVAQANPDRIVLTGQTAPHPILEIKTSRVDDEWADDAPPARVRVQVQHQLGVTGAPWADVAVLLHGRTYRQFRVARDDAAIAWLFEFEASWWRTYVTTGAMPPVDGHPSTTDALRDLYAEVDRDQAVELDPAIVTAFEELERVRAEIKAAKGREAELRNRVVAALGTAGVGRHDGVDLVTARPFDRTDLDESALKDDRPRLHALLKARYGSTTTVRPVRRAPKPKGER